MIFRLWMATLTVAFFALLSWAVFLNTGAHAQEKKQYPPSCYPVELVLDVMNKQKMQILWKAIGMKGETYALFVRPDGYWAVVAMAPDMSMACIPTEGPRYTLEGKGA